MSFYVYLCFQVGQAVCVCEIQAGRSYGTIPFSKRSEVAGFELLRDTPTNRMTLVALQIMLLFTSKLDLHSAHLPGLLYRHKEQLWIWCSLASTCFKVLLWVHA